MIKYNYIVVASFRGLNDDVIVDYCETEDEAMEYIDKYDGNEYTYCYSDEEYPCIEIEEHNEDGSITSVITID